MNRKTTYITVAILLAVVFALWQLVFQVRESDIALVTTFGKPTEIITNAGPYFKWPWPIQRVLTFDQRIQNFEGDKLDEPQTADGKVLLVTVYVGWQITDPGEFYSRFANRALSEPEKASIASAEAILEGSVRSWKNAVVGKHPFSDFISTDPAQFKLEAIEKEMQAAIEADVTSNHYGMQIRYLGIKKLELPASSTTQVFAQMTAERQQLVSQIQSDGAKQAAEIQTAAASYSAKLLGSADAEAKRIRGEAQAQSLKYLTVFEQNPDLAIFLSELDAMQASLGSKSTLILDSQTEPYNLLQITNAPGRK